MEWTENPPPRNIYVQASYDGATWFEAKTCKRGCCIFANGDSMILPQYWKPIGDQSGIKST